MHCLPDGSSRSAVKAAQAEVAALCRGGVAGYTPGGGRGGGGEGGLRGVQQVQREGGWREGCGRVGFRVGWGLDGGAQAKTACTMKWQ